MKIQPMKKFRTPIYPTRLAVQSDSGLLLNHMPPVWKKTAVIASLAAFLLSVNEGESREKAARVAPIFEHGEGRGAMGCVMIVPPVFLSEEEALQIIQEELSKANVELPIQDFRIHGVDIQKKREIRPKSATEVENLNKTPYFCDIANASQGIAIEFVSQEEYFDLGGIKNEWISSQDYDFKEIASQLAKQVKMKAKNLHFGCFYDPFTRIPTEPVLKNHREVSQKIEEIRMKRRSQNDPPSYDDPAIKEISDNYCKWIRAKEDEAKLESKRLLRLQVKDFTDWLKGQGVI